MDTPHIRMGHPYDQTPPNLYADYEWVRQHETDLLQKYGEKFIVVYQGQVLGIGDTRPDALADAENHVASTTEKITPVIYKLHQHQIFFRARPVADDE